MSWDEYIEQLSWRKIMLIVAGVFLAASTLQTIVFMKKQRFFMSGVRHRIQSQAEMLERFHQQLETADREVDKIFDETTARVRKALGQDEKRMSERDDRMEEKA